MPTKEEIQRECYTRALDAAWSELQTLDIGPDTDRNDVAGMVLRAFKAAESELAAGSQMLDEAFPDGEHWIGTDASSVVCAAFWYRVSGAVDGADLSEIHPNCGGSESIIGIVKAFNILDAVSNVAYAVEFGGDPGGSVDDALAALKHLG